MFNKWFYRRLPYFIRRRISPQQSPFILVAILALFVFIFQFLSLIFQESEDEKILRHLENRRLSRKPVSNVLGIEPKMQRFYTPNTENMFQCINSKIFIPFEWVNDDFCDCTEDGSDEPATGACQNSKFYCTQHDSR